MDIRDLLEPTKSKFTFTGSYYGEEFEQGKHPVRKAIRYKFENPHSTTYRTLFSTVQSFDSTTTAIRTNTNVGFKVGGYIVLLSGEMHVIEDIVKDYNTAPQQVFRLGNCSAGIEYVLRLVKRDNPWGVK